MKPKIEFMKALSLTVKEIRTALCWGPRLLNCNLEKTVRPNILYLQNLFGSEAIVFRVFKSAPQILVNSNMPECLEKKLKLLENFGLLENEIKELCMRNPVILNVHIDKMQKITDFLIHEGLPAKFILTCPLVLAFSLESRIKPRHRVLTSISEMQHSRGFPNLNSALYLSDGKFLEKYVNCSPHATELLEIYRGKPVGLDIIQ